ncbi:hypothetical protein LX32DRAFT_147541 [Colletotrichum zoysiae]|uniref:Uncharacterized protein n=1 Tax=Colletotrichum zoysiae TaxID=1216348 RepID=A0AAD9H6X5_9PEZI|nr:hypothetical protein LX32DRAFT_147541 [Colletotrichum zoysiae]
MGARWQGWHRCFPSVETKANNIPAPASYGINCHVQAYSRLLEMIHLSRKRDKRFTFETDEMRLMPCVMSLEIPPSLIVNHPLHPGELGQWWTTTVLRKLENSGDCDNNALSIKVASTISQSPDPPSIVGVVTMRQTEIAACRAKGIVRQQPREREGRGRQPIFITIPMAWEIGKAN